MCNYFNNFTDNVCCPTTIWMCDEGDNECFFHNSDIKSTKPPCVKCYYCFVPFAMIVDIICCPLNMYSHCVNTVKNKEENKEENKKKIEK